MIRKVVNTLAIVIGVVALVASVGWLVLEQRWSAGDTDGPKDGYAAFTHGAFGLEAFPIKYAVVAGRVSPAAFRTTLEDGRSLWETYGFLANPKAKDLKEQACQGNAEQWLPYGFAVTNSLPQTAVQTPLKFAGLTCASCHSGQIRKADGSLSAPISGMGNMELDVIAFSDAVRNAVLDPDLTADRILDEYAKLCPNDSTGPIEAFMLDQWLSGARAGIGGETSKYGLPYHGAALKSADAIPAGPGRTRPFRSIVRVAMDLPGEDNYAYSKIPVVFEQATDLRPRAQYDGSLGDPVTRSFTAAYASGSSVTALSKPEVVADIKAAAAYTEKLGIEIPVQPFAAHFPDAVPDPAEVARGFEVYKAYCSDCHGYRPVAAKPTEVKPWVAEGRYIHHMMGVGPKAPADGGLGVDADRVTFRYAHDLPLTLWTALPGNAAVAAVQEARLDKARNDALAAGDPALAYYWDERKSAFLEAKRIYRTGHPLYFPACPEGDGNCKPEDLLAKAPPCADDMNAVPQTCEITDYEAFVNNPIPYAFLRAPYLHNGSVPTMAQLLNLEPRPTRFCRGQNVYDPDALGYVTPAPVDGKCADPRQAFLFDTTVRGNGNQGHDYPWKPEELNDERRAELRALLAYLKTI
ncbi:MAG: cytochrome c [Alphaproteobacteria bacterium]|nr:cytochrome c [Alphaproteobacteria bacterium]MCB9928727.1 cytochrome c [Alphaproteobacteria bacterium]